MQISNKDGSVSLKAATFVIVGSDEYTLKVEAAGLTHENKQVTVFLTFTRDEINLLTDFARVI